MRNVSKGRPKRYRESNRYPFKAIDSIAKLVPSRLSITIEDAVKETPLLQKQLAENEKINEWFALAKRVEGIPRHASTHADWNCH
ncbi:hypothetical protein KHA80_16315 [Anaerobacillus sp. HL2]|nr:hypothetical protein KHA80_16315 [Anaerobacillus sp. HL2]